MNRNKRWAIRGLGLAVGATLMIGLIALAQRPGPSAAVREGVTKIAALLEKNDTAAAEKLTAELSKPGSLHVMSLFGPTIGAVSAKGVTDKDLADHADTYKDAGYRAAAIASLLRASGKETDKKKQADWEAFTKDLQEAGLGMADAAGKKDGAALKAAAIKANGACAKCHETFRPPSVERVRTSG
jgi:hypothetical protein